jgi:signal transduction histidine kinase
LPDVREETTLSRAWEGDPIRSVYTPISDADGRLHGWLEVTGFEWSLHQELENLRTSMLVGIVLGVLLAIGGGYLLARRALQPVASLTEAAKEIHATDLNTRLPTSFGVRDELSDLAETFNNMIERLEASFERERRFTNNAAHEILTPLATIRNSAEIALRRVRTPEKYKETIRSILADAEEMTDTVRGLLQLARVDRIQELTREKIDLSAAVERHIARLCDRAQREGIELAVNADPGVTILADEGRIGEVVTNLVDNAVKYTPHGGHVDVSVRSLDGRAQLVVSDSGVGFNSEQAEHLFDRFYRADVPEVQARSGSGLGLAIVKAIVSVYGGRVAASSEGKGRGSTFLVELPAVGE